MFTDDETNNRVNERMNARHLMIDERVTPTNEQLTTNNTQIRKTFACVRVRCAHGKAIDLLSQC